MLSPSRVGENICRSLARELSSELPTYMEGRKRPLDSRCKDLPINPQNLSTTQKTQKTPSDEAADDDTESLSMACRDSTLQTTLSGGGTWMCTCKKYILATTSFPRRKRNKNKKVKLPSTIELWNNLNQNLKLGNFFPPNWGLAFLVNLLLSAYIANKYKMRQSLGSLDPKLQHKNQNSEGKQWAKFEPQVLKATQSIWNWCAA